MQTLTHIADKKGMTLQGRTGDGGGRRREPTEQEQRDREPKLNQHPLLVMKEQANSYLGESIEVGNKKTK